MTESTLMPASTDFLHTQQPAGPAESAMNTLYRAALGPIRPESYLPRFERFDTLGRTQPGWNWAASLCTLNWMALRHLWTPALIYVAAAEGLGLLLFGAIRTLLPWPEPVQWGLVGAYALLAFALPGLYGDAILHTEIRKRIARALASTRSLPEACAQLEQQAASKRRLAGLAALNAGLLGVAALAYQFLPQGNPAETPVPPAIPEAPVPSISASAPQQAASGALLSPLPEPAPTASASAATVAASEPASAQPTASTPVAAPPVLEQLPPTSPMAAPTPAASATTPQASGTSPRSAAVKPAAKPTPAARKPDSKAVTGPQAPASAPEAPTPQATGASAPATGETLPQVGSQPGYYINVGLFAEEANARKAQAKLLNAGLPAFRQSLDTPKGQRIRVRVGPYPSAAQAQAAARSIKALHLDAVVFRQGASENR